MNWKLIFALSMFALAMAFATVFWLPGKIEPFFWLPIFIFCAYMFAKRQPDKLFLHGLCLGLANCFWITIAHAVWVKDYLILNPEMQKYYDAPFIEHHPRLSMGIMGLGIGVISGCVIGLFTLIARRLMKK